MVKKQVKCQRCKRIFWSPVKKAYILIAKKVTEKSEKRVVKGAFMNRVKADGEREKLERKLCPKQFDKIDIEPQQTIQKFLCQRCQNAMSVMQNRAKHQKAVEKRIIKERPTRVIPKEDVAQFMRYQVQQKVVQDYRKKQQEEARKKRTKEIKKKEAELRKLQAEKDKVRQKVLRKLKNDKAKKPVGEDKRKPA